jgi:hypothetical protein
VPAQPKDNRDQPPSYVRTAEVAAVLHLSPKTVGPLGQGAKLPLMRTLGGYRRSPEAQIRDLLEQPPGGTVFGFEQVPAKPAQLRDQGNQRLPERISQANGNLGWSVTRPSPQPLPDRSGPAPTSMRQVRRRENRRA